MNKHSVALAAAALAAALAGCGSTSTTTGTPPPPTQTSTAQSGIGQGTTSSPAAPPTSAPPTSAPPSTSVPTSDVAVCVTPVVTCQGELKTEPSQIIVSGDGSAFITGLVWTGWGLPSATGSGTLKLDNCIPNCAQGTFTPYQVTVVLSDLTPYGGRAAYATMLVAAPGSPYGTKTFHHLAP